MNESKWPFALKEQARAAICSEITYGRMLPATEQICVSCGQPARDYHHHKGYDKEHWLDVQPLCRACHARLKRLPNTKQPRQTKPQEGPIPIRHLDYGLYQQVLATAIRRRTNVAVLLNEMMAAWLEKEETR